MADFRIQHGYVDIPFGGISATINAVGTVTSPDEYLAPAGLDKADIKITGIEHTSSGVEDNDFAGTPGRNNVVIDNPGNLLTSITFSRNSTSNGPLRIFFEITEYIGAAAGPNEIIFRHVESITHTGTTTIDSSVISGVADASKIVVLTTGHKAADNSGRSESGAGRLTWEFVSASNIARGTQDNTTRNGDVSISVREYTGSNWTVQRIEHIFAAAATTETESVSSVGAITNAYFHAQSRYSQNNGGPDYSGFEVWFSSATELSFLSNEINTGQAVVVWLVSNPDMSVEHITGTRADNAGGGTDPDSWTETHSSAEADVSTISIYGECAHTDKTNDVHLNRIGIQVSSPTVINLYRSRDEGNRTYRFSVVSWPEDSGSGPEDQPIDPPLIAPGGQVFSPTVSAGDAPAISPLLIAASGQVFNPTVSPGDAPAISPARIESVSSVYAPTLTAGEAPAIQPALIAATGQIFQPTVSPGDAPTITPTLIASSAIVFSPTISQQAANEIFPPLIVSAAVIFDPTISPGDAPAISPALIEAVETVYTPTISASGPSIEPGLIVSNTQVYQPNIIRGDAPAIVPALIPSNDVVFTPGINGAVLSYMPADAELATRSVSPVWDNRTLTKTYS